MKQGIEETTEEEQVHAESGSVGIDVAVSDLVHVHGTFSALSH